MILKTIDDFRRENGVGPVLNWNTGLKDNCLKHTLAMINRGELYHTPDRYLEDYQEIVGACSYLANFEDTIRSLIFEMGTSLEHKRILLGCNEMGCGEMVYNGNLIITIRGRS